MGCCGEEEADEVHRPLISEAFNNNSNIDDEASGAGVISPMNSNFSALACNDSLRLIFEKLSIADLARASCVCRSWNFVAADKEIVSSAFKAPWKLKEVVGTPSDNSIGKFAISHRILGGDSVTSLAVKYSAQVMDIKRLNNMMSDHGIYSRERLLIPVSSLDFLIDQTCYIELDTHAKREFAVLYPNGRSKVLFDWGEDIRDTWSFLVKNYHQNEFYLKTVTLENVPSLGRIPFVCNSWVYPVGKCDYDRIFFSNLTYLPSDTPLPLLKYRSQELVNMRGHRTENFEEHDEFMNMLSSLYNDLGYPDRGDKHARQTLGGSTDFPYPRRARQEENLQKLVTSFSNFSICVTDPTTESRLPFVLNLTVYVPRDERLGHLKMSDFLADALKAALQGILPALESLFDKTPAEFDTFQRCA